MYLYHPIGGVPQMSVAFLVILQWLNQLRTFPGAVALHSEINKSTSNLN